MAEAFLENQTDQKNQMPRLFFYILSVVYISAIFILGGSPMAHDLSRFNPYSLLHIPLYGILTVLLALSFVPTAPLHLRSGRPLTRFLIAGFIALIVAMADEIYQTSIPGRDGSIGDVLLDLAGITLTLFLMFRFLKAEPR